MNIPTKLIALLLAAPLVGCASETLYVAERAALLDAYERVEDGRYEEVQAPLEQLVANMAEGGSDYTLQRFYAALLLVRSNLGASVHGPFLAESASGRAVGDKPSWIAQTVAASYEMSYAEGWAPAAMTAPASIDGVALVPEALADYGVPRALDYLALGRLFVASRLGFQQDVGALLQELPELLGLATCEERMADVQLDPELQPWILFGVFEHLSSRDEPEAYRFGIRARQLAGASQSATAADLDARIVDWILFGSSYVFESNRGVPFDPGLSGDPDAGQANIDYLARKKETG